VVEYDALLLPPGATATQKSCTGSGSARQVVASSVADSRRRRRSDADDGFDMALDWSTVLCW
jgi:hypothetical protein